MLYSTAHTLQTYSVPSIRTEAHCDDSLRVTRHATGASGDCSHFELCLWLVNNLKHLLCIVMIQLLQCLLQRAAYLCLIDVELVWGRLILYIW